MVHDLIFKCLDLLACQNVKVIHLAVLSPDTRDQTEALVTLCPTLRLDTVDFVFQTSNHITHTTRAFKGNSPEICTE